MKIVLINIPVLTEHNNYAAVRRLLLKNSSVYLSPQIGILTVASLFRNAGWDVRVIDINAAYETHLKDGKRQQTFCESFSVFLSSLNATHYGFSTMCSSYYFTLNIAKNVKKRTKQSLIILGGPQATATAFNTLEKCRYIDYILCGEVENSIGLFTKEHISNPHKVPNLAWRNTSKININKFSVPINMDSIPTPAYDLWDMRSIEVIHIEGGRGCPFNCKFCSTNIYFGRNYRLKDPKKLVEESVRVVKKYKVKHITFVHDNLFIKAKDCEEFCRVWCSRPELTNVHWACSLRVEVITKELVCEIAKSNCSGVFLGIESGSKRIQQIINKKIDPLAAKVAIETLQNHGIHSTTSFIIGFPEETESDLEQTLQFYGEMLRNPLTKPQASVLAVLPKSGYDHIDSSNLKYTGEISSMAHQGSVIPEDLLILIKESPDLFPSHHVPLLEYIGRDFIYECENFLKYVTGLYRWLIVMAIDCLGGNLKMLLDLWWDFVSEKGTTGDRFEYYSSIIFRKHFDEFMSSLMNNDKYSTKYRYIYKFLLQVYSSNNIRRNLAELSKKRNTPANVNTSTSFLRRKCTVETVSFSFRKIIDALSGKGNLQLVTEGTFYLIAYIHNEEIILEEPTELTLGVLNTIPNERRVDDILDELSSTYSHLLPEAQQHQISSRFAHALSVLSEQGVIEYC